MTEEMISWLRAQLDRTVPHSLSESILKREILALWHPFDPDAEAPEFNAGYAAALGQVIALIAEQYDYRPGYQEEWRP